jgi:hypothetical protein
MSNNSLLSNMSQDWLRGRKERKKGRNKQKMNIKNEE